MFEVVQKVKMVNRDRKRKINSNFKGKSYDNIELKNNDFLAVDYIVATPRMQLYMKYSVKIYHIYLKYLDSKDIHVYSIDEIFCDITNYLKMNKMSAKEFITKIVKDVYDETGITATAGIGTNMYLAKIAMDIVAKHIKANEYGVRVAFLDEKKYRKLLWNHQPITDFWRVGKGIASSLAKYKIYTMGDIARMSINNENLLYKLFGINAELLIDHAWGYEPCTIQDIKNYKPISNSLSSGQVLHEPYDYDKAKLIVKEMGESLTLSMVEKHYVTNQIVLTVGYDVTNFTNNDIRSLYDGEIVTDFYGRKMPKPAHGTIRIDHMTSSTKIINSLLMKLFNDIVNPVLLVKRINIAVCNLELEENSDKKVIYKQMDLFSNREKEVMLKEKELNDEKEEKKIQETILKIKNKYGKNSILRGMNLISGSTIRERNEQVGGHKG